MKNLIKAAIIAFALSMLTACSEGSTSDVTQADVTTEVTATAPPVTTKAVTSSTVCDIDNLKSYFEVSEDNIFIDFEYIVDYPAAAITPTVQPVIDAAFNTLIDSEYYETAMDNFDSFTAEHLNGYLDETGSLMPVLNKAYIDDFDCDGSKEAFVFLDMPYSFDYRSFPVVTFLVYVDSECVASVINRYTHILGISLLDYGMCRQLIVELSGGPGFDMRSSLYGVVNGEPVMYYEFRGDFYKIDCFLSGIGYQTSGDLMYFDTHALEYRIIEGEEISFNDLLPMDSTNILSKFIDQPLIRAYLIGKKYYCVIQSNWEYKNVYTYQNGEFISQEDSHMRLSFNYNNYNAVVNIDMDKAVREMKQPDEITD